jgi:hypothetical protein
MDRALYGKLTALPGTAGYSKLSVLAGALSEPAQLVATFKRGKFDPV